MSHVRYIDSRLLLMGPYVLLSNKWFDARTDAAAALLLLRARQCENDTKTDSDCTPSVAQEYPMDRAPVATAEPAKAKEIDQRLWDGVEACGHKLAIKATIVRAVLVARVGKQDAALILGSCTAVITKHSNGHNNRVLKAPTGELLKLKTQS